MNYYSSKSSDYYQNVRLDIISLIPQNRKLKVLEIGAGACNTLVYLKENGFAGEITGVELFAMPNSNQQNELIDKLYISDIESAIPDLKKGYFDVIIMGDVLEHLIDPWSVVTQVKECLNEAGIIIASIPNIREITVMYKIFFRGDFGYTSEGIMDKTHMRFFCKKNMIQLFESSGLKIQGVYESFKRTPQKSIRGIFNMVSFGLFSQFLTTQYITVCKG
jgi:2-polyprenyl-3-methyl-5-hydroxy-6-metoxy-1,4-benzoquinol methylase